MKPTIALLFSTLSVAFAAPPRAELAQVRRVYLLPMSNGMDQYLANRLTSLGVFQVVTDPKKADAIFTDRLGEAFENRQAEWFPDVKAPLVVEAAHPVVPPAAPAPVVLADVQPAVAPETEAPAPAPSEAAATPQTAPATAPPAADKPAPAAPQPPVEKAAVPAETPKPAESKGGLKGDRTTPVSAFHRSKGTLFLVDPRSRLVLWSTYAEPKDSSAIELDRTAARVASQIRQDLKGR